MSEGGTRSDRLDRIADELPRPQPVIHPDTAGFWEGLEAGELRVQVCANCGTHRFPFGPVCFRCRSFESGWRAIEPAGRVAAVVVVHRATGDPEWAGHVPFLSGTVDLDHGLRLPGRILCTCGEARQHGTPVRAVLLTAAERSTVHAFAHECVPAGGA